MPIRTKILFIWTLANTTKCVKSIINMFVCSLVTVIIKKQSQCSAGLVQ